MVIVIICHTQKLNLVTVVSRSGGDGHLSGVSISDISHLEGVVDTGDAINSELPHTDDAEEVSDVCEDTHDDITDVPVDQVADEISRLCHFNF